MRLVPDVTPILIHLTIYLEVLVKFPDQWLVGVCVCVCDPWSHRDPFGLFFVFAATVIRFAWGTDGADEAGANKDAHQSPVIQLETSNCVPAFVL